MPAKRGKKKNSRTADWEAFFPFLKYRLLSTAPGDLTALYGMEEGIENRLVKKINRAEHFSDFIAALKTKRYTWTRLQRLATHVLTGAKKNVMKSVLDQEKIPYLRLLGMNQAGQDYLHSIKKQLSVPLISKIKKDRHPLLELDIRTAQLYEFIVGLQSPRKDGGFQETEKAPIRFEERTGRFF
ncbi:nucleotidyltransferase family protein [Terrilactibacillus sp. S3-3]|nr:nucleotidyltransferase family protein [Terrilactibacillus sp. S3-3]